MIRLVSPCHPVHVICEVNSSQVRDYGHFIKYKIILKAAVGNECLLLDLVNLFTLKRGLFKEKNVLAQVYKIFGSDDLAKWALISVKERSTLRSDGLRP